MKKVLLYGGIGLVVVILGFVMFVQFTYNVTFDVPFPEIKASTDPAVIARGEYLVYGPAHCASCHVPKDKLEAVDKGEKVPLIGGFEIPIPPGTFRPANITPDKETGIGRRTDQELARTLRYQVNHRGEAIVPFMPFGQMSEEDLIACISYLRSMEPVKNEIQESEYTFLGKIVKRLALKPDYPPKQDPPKRVPEGPTKEYGEYLAFNVANCHGCHTDRDLKTGEFIGEPYAGGLLFEDDPIENKFAYVAPNLTPDQQTGVMAKWSEEQFVTRMKAGRVHKGSPMPWGPFSRMKDDDLVAIYKFLKTVKPVKNNVEKTKIPFEEL